MMNLNELASYLQASLYFPATCKTDGKLIAEDFSPLDLAGPNDISFLSSPKARGDAFVSKAGAIIVGEKIPEISAVQVIHPHPRLAMTRASQLFHKIVHSFSGKSKLAAVDETAHLHESVVVYPFAFIGARTTIGKNCVIYPNVFIGDDCRIEEGCVIYPGAVLMQATSIGARVVVHAGAVIGADGFGFTPSAEGILKIPQKGSVDIHADCEIGPLATIDRATFSKTILRQGCKLDSQVHVGHNVDVGAHSMLCGQVGIAGSTKIGERFVAAGQTGVGPGLEIGDGVIAGPKTGLTQNVKEKGEYLGMPASPAGDWRKQVVALKKLPQLFKKVAQLEKQLAHLSEKID